jgi:hypothetical protein
MSEENRHHGFPQEEDKLPGGMVLKVLGAAVAIALGGSLWAYLLLDSREAAFRPSGAFPERELKAPGEARSIEQVGFFFEAVPGEYIREKQREILETYGEDDPEGKTVRIPIERAIELYVKGAAPARKAAAPETAPAATPASAPASGSASAPGSQGTSPPRPPAP